MSKKNDEEMEIILQAEGKEPFKIKLTKGSLRNQRFLDTAHITLNEETKRILNKCKHEKIIEISTEHYQCVDCKKETKYISEFNGDLNE